MLIRLRVALFAAAASALLLAQTVGAKTTINYTSWTADKEEKQLIDMFMKENPSINVKITSVAGGPPVYVEKLLTSLIAGVSPDVLRINHECIIPLYQAKGLLNLSPYIKQAKLDMKDFYDPNVKLFQFDGKQLGIPISHNNCVVFYNKKMLSEAGVPDLAKTAAAPNWTRDAFLSVARKLTRDTNGDGKNEFWGVGDVPSWVMDMYVTQAGGQWYTKDGRKCTINSAEAVDGLSFIWDMRQKYKVWNPAATWDSIAAKRSATQIVAGWAINLCVDAKIDFDVADIFTYKAPRFFGPSGDGYGISSGSKKKDAAWKLVQFLTSEKAISYLSKTGIISPSRKSVAKGDAFVKLPGAPKNREAFLKTMDYTAVFEPRYIKKSKTVNTAINTIMDQFYAGKKSPQQTVAEIESNVNRLLK